MAMTSADADGIHVRTGSVSFNLKPKFCSSCIRILTCCRFISLTAHSIRRSTGDRQLEALLDTIRLLDKHSLLEPLWFTNACSLSDQFWKRRNPTILIKFDSHLTP